MAHATVPRCSHPYASTPMVCPANFLRLHGLWIDLSKGRRPAGCKSHACGENESDFTSDSHCKLRELKYQKNNTFASSRQKRLGSQYTRRRQQVHQDNGWIHRNGDARLQMKYANSNGARTLLMLFLVIIVFQYFQSWQMLTESISSAITCFVEARPRRVALKSIVCK